MPEQVLIPECVELARQRIAPLTGQPVQVVAAGGMYNGKSLAAALAYGATGVWVGTCARALLLLWEISSPGADGSSTLRKRASRIDISERSHQLSMACVHLPSRCASRDGEQGIVRTLIYSGRPLSVGITDEVRDWHEHRHAEMTELLDKGEVPAKMEDTPELLPFLMGQVRWRSLFAGFRRESA